MRQLMGYAMSALVLSAVAYAFAPRSPASLPDTQLQVDRIQVNDLVLNNGHLVAVGERGTILFSRDNAVTWESAVVEPQRGITLTGLTSLNDQVLLAVGHDGWLLRSEDGGQHWQEALYDAELGEPLLGIWNASADHAIAFGSFGKFFESHDAGRTWLAREVNPEGFHLNGMDGSADGRQMLVGEQGLVMRSEDSGASWETLEPFYNGSLFGVVSLTADRWVAYGMRGHVFVSEDFGQSWQQVELPHGNPLYGHVVLPDEAGLILVGAGSSLVHLDHQGRLLENSQRFGLGTLTSAVMANAQVLLLGGQRGVHQGQENRMAEGQ